MVRVLNMVLVWLEFSLVICDESDSFYMIAVWKSHQLKIILAQVYSWSIVSTSAKLVSVPCEHSLAVPRPVVFFLVSIFSIQKNSRQSHPSSLSTRHGKALKSVLSSMPAARKIAHFPWIRCHSILRFPWWCFSDSRLHTWMKRDTIEICF